MTHRAKTPSDAQLLDRSATWKRKLFRGLAVSAAILGLCGVAVLVPASTPPNVATPANKGLHLGVTESVRAAYVQALIADGYVFLPTITMDDTGDA